MAEPGLREIISARHAPDARATRSSVGKAMLAEVSAVVRAPAETVLGVYADYQNWPGLFPTISGVRLVSRNGQRLALAVDHAEGRVPNELILRCPDDIDLWEVKHRYDACFATGSSPSPRGPCSW